MSRLWKPIANNTAAISAGVRQVGRDYARASLPASKPTGGEMFHPEMFSEFELNKHAVKPLPIYYSSNFPEIKTPIPKHIPDLEPSKVHPSLSKVYKVDGIIPFGTKILPPDQEALPSFGKWGVPLRLRTRDTQFPMVLPNFWLRDNCRCKKCVNQDTMQRAFDTFAIRPDVIPSTVVTAKDGLHVTWKHDGHASLYPWDWILKQKDQSITLLDENQKPLAEAENPDIYWGAGIKSHPPSVSYDEIMADNAGVGTWTNKIRQYGFCYVDGCPPTPEKTQQLLERIAFIRITHYGGFYDFTSDLTMKDTAYTTLALPAHTDTTYFTDPAGLQMFHLLSHEQGSGGESLLVDGFRAAKVLAHEDPAAFNTLSNTPVPWHASGNEGITITPSREFPVLNFNSSSRSHLGIGKRDNPARRLSKLMQVRWNNDDRGTVPGLRGATEWYQAARKWNEILTRKDSEYWAQLEPGRPLIFDNWRVLHGRSAFTGKRRICGGYINRDDYISRWLNTNFSREEVLKKIL